MILPASGLYLLACYIIHPRYAWFFSLMLSLSLGITAACSSSFSLLKGIREVGRAKLAMASVLALVPILLSDDAFQLKAVSVILFFRFGLFLFHRPRLP